MPTQGGHSCPFSQPIREYCFGEEDSLSLTEFWAKLGEFCEKLGEFTEFSPWSSLRAKMLTEFGVWNPALRNRIQPVSEFGMVRAWHGSSGSRIQFGQLLWAKDWSSCVSV